MCGVKGLMTSIFGLDLEAFFPPYIRFRWFMYECHALLKAESVMYTWIYAGH